MGEWAGPRAAPFFFAVGGRVAGLLEIRELAVILTINGSYEAYIYVVLLQISNFYLSRPNLQLRIQNSPASNPLINFYCLITGFIATVLNWTSWLLAVHVGTQFGLGSGLLFFALGFGSSILASIILLPYRPTNSLLHVVSVPATIYLFWAMLGVLGIHF